jgi:hypothetical protein
MMKDGVSCPMVDGLSENRVSLVALSVTDQDNFISNLCFGYKLVDI